MVIDPPKNKTYFADASILKKFLDRQISYNDFLKLLISGKNCSTLISKSSAQGIIFKTCAYNKSNSDCDKCRLKLAIKIYINGSSGRHEYNILNEIKNAFKNQTNERLREAYMKRVISYKIFINYGRAALLVTKFVEFSPDRAVNMKKYLLSGNCSQLTLDCLIVEILFTLQYLHNNVPGFVHFDMLTQQVFLSRVKEDEWLPLPYQNETFCAFMPLSRKYRGILGDFGYSNTEKNKLNKLFDYPVRTIGFDIYRFLGSVLNECKSTALEDRAKLWVSKALPNYSKILNLGIQFAIESKKDTSGYLPKEAESLLPKSVGEIFKKFFPLQIKNIK